MTDTRLSLETRQRQQQALTPMQMQFVRVLEMSEPEVEDEVREALDENPALEVADDPVDSVAEEFNESAEQIQLADYRSEEDIPAGSREASNMGAYGLSMFEPVVSSGGDTLMESLLRQLAEAGASDDDMAIAKYIVGNMDDNGYMVRDISAIADDITIDSGVDVSLSRVRRVFDKIRRLEPAGVGAVDLRDCLMLQLQRQDDASGADKSRRLALEIVTHYFDVFSKMHFDRLLSMLGVSRLELEAAIERIRALNPKPGALITGGAEEDRTRHITPDFIVETDPVERTTTVSVANHLPRLQVERSFRLDPDQQGRESAAAAAFVRQKRDEAMTFIKVLEMRQETLLNVMSAIVSLQKEFFLTEDVSTLRPMILKDVGAITGYDLSVISRATAGKYVATQRAIYPLRFFFSERPNDSSEASSHEIRQAIREMVAAESKSSPLSDTQITEQLNAKGYGIARRTVAKYREKLGIPVGRLRKI